jgi:hypothetical protein
LADFRYRAYRVYQDFRVGTAASDTVKSQENFFPGRPAFPFQQRRGGQDLSGPAKSTGFKTGPEKTGDNVLVLVGLGESLNGDYLASPDPERGNQAGFNDLAVKNDRTNTALSA